MARYAWTARLRPDSAAREGAVTESLWSLLLPGTPPPGPEAQAARLSATMATSRFKSRPPPRLCRHCGAQRPACCAAAPQSSSARPRPAPA